MINKLLSLESWNNGIRSDRITFNLKGDFALNRATAYGVTISYYPTFMNLNELIFENSNLLYIRNSDNKELHVNRNMNVWASGGSHKLYFKSLDKYILKIFNRPLKKQPLGIADMGCGDGSFLKHIYELVLSNTKRGINIKQHPLYIIGADLNDDALESTKNNLINAGISHYLVKASIEEPKEFSKILKRKFNLDLENFLNVRSFLDHNRIYKKPNKKDIINNQSLSSGAFVYKGRMLYNYEIETNLISHLMNWKPFIKNHGLLLIELHTISPFKASKNRGSTLAIPYDSTHGFSDQFIVESEIFEDCAKKAGLTQDPDVSTYYPNKDIPTVTVNLYK